MERLTVALIFLAILIIITVIVFIKNYQPKSKDTTNDKKIEQSNIKKSIKDNKGLVISTVIIQIVLITTIIIILVY